MEALGVDASMKVAKPHPIERVTRQKKRDIEAEAGVSPRRSSKCLKGKVNSANSAAEEDDSNHAFAKGDGGIAELKVLIRCFKIRITYLLCLAISSGRGIHIF